MSGGLPSDLYGDMPFEAQEEPRGCGAACLAMVYAALGRPARQAEIWSRVARRNSRGSLASTTHLMARDATEQGFAALALQLRDPLASLRACSDGGVQAILAARTSPDELTGHYTVLLDIDSSTVRLHDPAAGPRRTLPHDALLSLWDGAADAGEVTGRVLIAIGQPEPGKRQCARCQAPAPEAVMCPRCSTLVGLRPFAALGCFSAACSARLWERVCCPECDLLWDAGTERPQAAPAMGDRAVDLGKVFAALDAFTAFAASSPGAATNPDLTRTLAEIGSMRGQLAEAVASDAADHKAMAERRQAAATQVAARIEAVRAQLPPLPVAPTEPTLDAAELSQALLERLSN